MYKISNFINGSILRSWGRKIKKEENGNERDIFEILGRKYTIEILKALSRGEMRYSNINEQVVKNPQTTTNRLEELQSIGLINKEKLSERHTEYSLTEKGEKVVAYVRKIGNL